MGQDGELLRGYANTMNANNISQLSPFDADSDAVNAIVETPRGCRTKYKYDEKTGLFQFDKPLPPGFTFPFEFGFLPSTQGEDGDPLDISVLSDEPTFVGCLILGRLLRILEAEQTEKGKTVRNDRIIAVPIAAKTHEIASSHANLDDKLAQSVEDFFIAYNEVQGKKFKVLGLKGPEDAARMIRESLKQDGKEPRKAKK